MIANKYLILFFLVATPSALSAMQEGDKSQEDMKARLKQINCEASLREYQFRLYNYRVLSRGPCSATTHGLSDPKECERMAIAIRTMINENCLFAPLANWRLNRLINQSKKDAAFHEWLSEQNK